MDGVVVFDEETPHELIAALQPDVLVKGADWAEDAIVGRDTVESRGGRVVRLPIEPDHSTTRIIQKIRTPGHRLDWDVVATSTSLNLRALLKSALVRSGMDGPGP